ncbi:MAG: glycosyltransferase family 4 protein [Desulfosalsimonas sp.]
MRVLIVQKRFHPNSIGLVKAIKARGHDVHMIVHFKSGNNPTEDQTVLETVHIPYYRFFQWFWNRFNREGRHKFSVPRLGPICKELGTFRPDLVILKKPRLPNLITGLLARLYGCKTVLLTNRSPSGKKTIIDRLPKAAGIRHRICTSANDPSALKNGWINGARFLPYPIEVPQEPYDRDLKNNRIKILCAGSLKNARKRPWWVVEAVHRADLKDDTEMTFAGLGSPESEGARRIFALARTYGLQDRVKILYNTPHTEMNELYFQHDLLVHPARTEPFGAVVLEAMACGLAVLCSDEVGARSCFVHGESGMIFPAESVDAMASCLKQMCRDPENLSTMGMKARQRVEKEYSGPAFVKHLESLMS